MPDPAIDGTEQTFLVCGVVRYADGRGAEDVRVTLTALGLRGDVTGLGEAVTGPEGGFEIRHRGSERAAVVTVAVPGDAEPLEQEPLPCPVPAEFAVELTLPDGARVGRVELDSLLRALRPAVEEVDLLGLDSGQRAALACAIDRPVEQVEALHAASGFAADAGEQRGHRVRPGVGELGKLVELGYALARQGCPLDAVALLHWGKAALLAALEQAQQRRIVTEWPAEQGEQLLGGLLARCAADLVEDDPADPVGVAAVLAATELPVDRRRDLLIGLAAHTGTVDDFWHQVRREGTLGEEEIPRVQELLQLAGLSLNQAAVAQRLARFGGVRDLALIDRDIWHAAVAEAAGDHLPPGLPGATHADQLDSYVDGMRAAARAAFPTAAASADLRAHGHWGEVADFLHQQSGFELGITTVDDYLADHDHQDVPTETVHRVRQLERVWRLVPDATGAAGLIDAGLHSAHHIARLPEEVFVARFGDVLGGPMQARSAHVAAASVSAGVANLYATIKQTLGGVSPAAVGDTPAVELAAAVTSRIPGWETLFGSASFCECASCRSVLSPAAYLVDLLHFLTPPVAPSVGVAPVEALFQRRPDLQYIKLTCENTNTALPYVDLVNEILETYIALDGPAAGAEALGRATAFDTAAGTRAADLAVNPAHVNEVAYDRLRAAYHPLALPYHRPLEMVRAFLAALGTTRAEVMRTLQHGGQPTAGALAAEALGLSPELAALITGTSAASLADCYGVAPGTLPGAVTGVLAFLRATGLHFADLMSLVETDFVNPGHVVSLDTPVGADPCDLSVMTLRNLDDATLDRAHRFLRLARARGTSFARLDAEIAALGAVTLDDAFLVDLATLDQLRVDLGLTAEQALALVGPIPVRPLADDQRSLYADLFQHPATASPADPTFDLDPAGTELAGTTGTISGHVTGVLAGLRLGAADLALLQQVLPDDALNLANLSQLYRHVLLARALGLRVAELLSLRLLTGVPVFASLVAMKSFVDDMVAVRGSGLDIAALDATLRSVTSPEAVQRHERRVTSAWARLRDGLRAVNEQTRPDGDATADVVKRHLSALLDADVAARVVGTLDRTTRFAVTIPGAGPLAMTLPDGLTGQAELVTSSRTLRSLGALTTNARTDLLALSADPNYVDAVAQLFDQPRDLLATHLAGALTPTEIATLLDGGPIPPATNAPDEPARFRFLLDRFLPFARRELGYAATRQVTVDEFGLAPGLAAALIDEVLRSPADGSRPLRDDLLAAGGSGLTVEYYPNVTLTGPAITRTEATVDVVWGDTPPDPGIPAGPFSGRWAGRLLARGDGPTTLRVQADDGVRLRVDGALVIDDWVDGPVRERAATTTFEAGTYHDVELEYYHAGAAPAGLRWSWGTSTTADATIGVEYLFRGDAVADLDAALVRLDRAAGVVTTLGLSPVEVRHLATHAASFAGFDLNAYPLVAGPAADLAAPALFAALRRVADYAATRAAIGGEATGEAGLTEVFVAASPVEARDRLAALGAWDPAELSTLDTEFALTAADYADERAPARLAAAIALAGRTGVPVAALASWALASVTAAQAAEVVAAAKAHFDDETWAAVAKPINDGLRDRGREALVAYLLPVVGAATPDALFEYFLIDTEMTSAMSTSRIKQAISSVQLFVQRCLLNLELTVSPSTVDSQQWTWRRNYRVWEANRQVFLFAENWLDPTLRDDKTDLFRDLESRLLQGEVTTDAVEQAFRGYLDGLEEISRLDLLAFCAQRETDGGVDADVIHLFGRTPTEPYGYFHRMLRGGTQWTPWTRIAADVSGTKLVPVVYQRQLRLYWPVYNDKRDGAHARMAWSVYRHGQWSRRRISPDDQALLLSVDIVRASELDWEARVVGDDLVLRCQDGQGVKSERKGGINSAIRYVSAYFYRDLGEIRFAGCGGGVTATVGLNKVREVSSSAYFYPVAGQPFGLQFYPLGPDGMKDPTVKVLDKALPGTRLVSQHSGGLVAPGELFVLSDSKHAYLARSRWARNFLGALRDRDFSQVYVDRAPKLSQRETAIKPDLISPVARSAQLLPVGGYLGASTTAGARGISASVAATALAVEEPAALPITSGTLGAAIGMTESDTAKLVDWLLLPTRQGDDIAVSFEGHYDPYVCRFISALNAHGVPGLLTLANQRFRDAAPTDDNTTFRTAYAPTQRAGRPYPHESVDFSPGGPFAMYHWELFFQTPLLIAKTFMDHQQFEQAQRWYHYIFDPTSVRTEPSPARYWNVLPFHDAPPAERLTTMLAALRYTGTDPAMLATKASVQAQLQVMAHDPFNPHHIARLRLSAYQKNVVMGYIDNLIAWGDQLYRRDTIEEINQATQLYLLAAALLGPKPEVVPGQQTSPRSYRDLLDSGGLDDFSNALVALENAFPLTIGGSVDKGPGATAPLGTTFYFCVPPNAKLLGYWDTVADRLFKIRHGLNIEGVARQLALFEPPIDPGVLVRARAAGVDLGSVLADATAPLPYHRFPVIIERAKQLCQHLTTLGAALLTALEKQDGEVLAALRATHEVALLDATARIRAQQIAEARLQVESLEKSQLTAIRRRDFYANTIRTGVLPGENDQLHNMDLANSRHEDAAGIEMSAQVANLLPNFTTGLGASITFGGQQVAAVLRAVAGSYEYLAASYKYKGERAALVAGHLRRGNDWQRELDLANAEIDQIGKQIAAADVRVTLADWEADNHQLQRDQAQATLDTLKDKYTNAELYRWHITQLAGVYFQTYRLVYDLAKQAERAYRFERAVADSSFIQFGYWDSLRRGLLAGDRLTLALAQLEDAYLRQHRRELELSKSVSLLHLDPLALVRLKATGQCDITLPETLYDGDHPGHYLRRIKSVGLTVPCVTGPYANVNATLRLLSSKTRTSSSAVGQYPERDNDARFSYSYGAIDAIATSHGQRDSGLFEVNLNDIRFLPFEGQGAISTWRLELPGDTNAYDINTVSDVILHVSYTARDGGGPLRDAARAASITPVTAGRRHLLSARSDFPSEWNRFLHPEPAATQQLLTLPIRPELFAFQLRSRTVAVTGARLFLVLADGTVYPGVGQPLSVGLRAPGDAAAAQQPLTSAPPVMARMPFTAYDLSASPRQLGEWSIEVDEAAVAKIAPPLRAAVTVGATTHQRLNSDAVVDLVVVLEYSA